MQKYGEFNVPFALSKQFQVEEGHEPTPIRGLLLCKSITESETRSYHEGFSFMLCDFKKYEWGQLEAIGMLKEHVNFFVRYTRSSNLEKEIDKAWPNVQISCMPKVDRNGIRHMIIKCKIEVIEEIGYLCINGDNESEAQSKVNSQYYWWFLCKKILDAKSNDCGHSLVKVRRKDKDSLIEHSTLQTS